MQEESEAKALMGRLLAEIDMGRAELLNQFIWEMVKQHDTVEAIAVLSHIMTELFKKAPSEIREPVRAYMQSINKSMEQEAEKAWLVNDVLPTPNRN